VFGLGSILWPQGAGLDFAVQLVVRSVVVYLFFLVSMRVFGKREVGQFTMPDLVLVLLAANALQPAITGPDSSLGGALIILVTMFVLNYVVTWLRAHVQLVDDLVSSKPVVIHGKRPPEDAVPDEEMRLWRSFGLTRFDVHEAIHEAGLESLDQVERIWLEESGRITVLPKSGVPVAGHA
jgi:uncharacterized membrane protein YcaP (DUF421 family)